MGLKRLVVVVALANFFVGSVHAGSPEKQPSTDDDRYSLSKLENGYLRLDKQSGDLTHCVIDDHDAWRCVILPETRTEHQKQIDGLNRENTTLRVRQKVAETRLVELEETLVDLRDRLADFGGDDGNKQTKPTNSLLSERGRRKLDEAVDLADGMVSGLQTMMRGLRDETKKLGSKIPKLLE